MPFSSKANAGKTISGARKANTSIRQKSVKKVTKGTTEWYAIIFVLIAVHVVSKYSPFQTLRPALLLIHIHSALTAPKRMPKNESLKRGVFLKYNH